MKSIPLLQKGDKIVLIAPAKAIESELINNAIQLIEERGYIVEVGKYCAGQVNYFSGTEEERLHDLQWALDHKEAKAILCARGGYGCVQLVDRADWSTFIAKPKWVIGFSDITVLHSRINNLDLRSIHATMPLNFENNSSEAIETLFEAFEKEKYTITFPNDENNLTGHAKGELIGGNFSILYSLIGTNDDMDFSGKVLFIEEVGEPLYAIDRMFYSLAKSGKLKQLNGIIVGGMTGMKDSSVPFGKSLEEIILKHISPLSIPLAFNAPFGHIDDNRAMRCGSHVSLTVGPDNCQIHFE